MKTDEHNDLIKKYPSAKDKKIIRKLLLVDAQIIQRVIDNVDDKEIVLEAFMSFREALECASILYDEDGIYMIKANSEISKDTDERRYLALKASKHSSFKIIEDLKWNETKCVERFGEQ